MGEDTTTAGFDVLAELIESDAGGNSKLSRVGDAALNELLRRLEDQNLAKELPGTGLLNIANAYVKLREKQLERDGNNPTGPEVDEVEMILSQPLPEDRKIKLLEDVVGRHNSAVYRARAAIDRLKGSTYE